MKEVKIVRFGYRGKAKTAQAKQKLTRLVNESWKPVSAGASGDYLDAFVILVRES